MKKFISLVLAVALIRSFLVACSPAAPAAEAPKPAESGAKAAADVKIVLLLPGEVNYQG